MLSFQVYVLCMLVTCSGVLSYRHLKLKIPNGFDVVHPCIGPSNRRTDKWSMVGHIGPTRRSSRQRNPIDRNPFGNDFENKNFVWSDVCKLDSDGDGLTNGVELGDPGCIWTEGATPTGPVKGHPGFCDTFRGARRRKCDKRASNYRGCRWRGSRPGPRPGHQPDPRSGSRPGHQPAARPGPRPGPRHGPRPTVGTIGGHPLRRDRQTGVVIPTGMGGQTEAGFSATPGQFAHPQALRPNRTDFRTSPAISAGSTGLRRGAVVPTSRAGATDFRRPSAVATVRTTGFDQFRGLDGSGFTRGRSGPPQSAVFDRPAFDTRRETSFRAPTGLDFSRAGGGGGNMGDFRRFDSGPFTFERPRFSGLGDSRFSSFSPPSRPPSDPFSRFFATRRGGFSREPYFFV